MTIKAMNHGPWFIIMMMIMLWLNDSFSRSRGLGWFTLAQNSGSTGTSACSSSSSPTSSSSPSPSPSSTTTSPPAGSSSTLSQTPSSSVILSLTSEQVLTKLFWQWQICSARLQREGQLWDGDSWAKFDCAKVHQILVGDIFIFPKRFHHLHLQVRAGPDQYDPSWLHIPRPRFRLVEDWHGLMVMVILVIIMNPMVIVLLTISKLDFDDKQSLNNKRFLQFLKCCIFSARVEKANFNFKNWHAWAIWFSIYQLTALLCMKPFLYLRAELKSGITPLGTTLTKKVKFYLFWPE